MRIELTPAEVDYLLRNLQAPIEYYRTLAGSAKCTPITRQRWKFFVDLQNKLQGITVEAKQ